MPTVSRHEQRKTGIYTVTGMQRDQEQSMQAVTHTQNVGMQAGTCSYRCIQTHAYKSKPEVGTREIDKFVASLQYRF